jgi:hypothetical protein
MLIISRKSANTAIFIDSNYLSFYTFAHFKCTDKVDGNECKGNVSLSHLVERF